MIQLLPKVSYNAGYGADYVGSMSVLGGLGSFSLPATFGVDYAKAPVAFDSTFRNLTILATAPFTGDIRVTLYVEGVASAQTVVLPEGSTTAVSAGADVVVTAGQDIYYRYNGPITGGSDIAYCIEREGVGNIYGMSPKAGGITVDTGVMGGAFNNGILGTAYVPGVTVFDSLTYSLTAVAGTITKLLMRTYAGAPGTGIWTGYLRVDAVLQDGAGGTVDTATVMTGTDTLVSETFSLPVTLGQRVDVVLMRTGISAPFALAQVAVGVGFLPGTADAFMCCGGSNDVISQTETCWKWTQSEQLGVGELRHVAPISATGLSVTGLYIERADPPATGTGYVHTLRRAGVSTEAVVTIDAPDTYGLIDGLSLSFSSGQTITLQSTPVADAEGDPPGFSRLYWGMAAFAGTTPEPPPVYESVTTPTRRLRRAPHLSVEQRWMFHNRLQIDLEAGVGLVDGQGEDPQVMLRWSNDGGHTWSNEQWRSAGRIGQYSRRVVFWRLGRARDRVYEMVVSDPVAWHVIDAFLDVTPGSS